MAKWTTEGFIKAFMRNELGRKRVHGTYRVLDGDHCKVLVRASTRYGKPTGNSLIAINMSNNTAEAFFYHQYNASFSYYLNKDLDMYNAPKLPTGILHDDNSNLLASGIIDTNDTEMLIEIGDKPYLLYKKLNGQGQLVRHSEGIPMFDAVESILTRVASISAAKELIKDPPGAEQLCGIWWGDKQPAGFQPPKLDTACSQTLSTPVNPLEHGYTLADCRILGDSDKGIGVLVPTAELLKEPHDHRAVSYIAARKNWNDACKQVKNRAPIKYAGLTVKKNKYSYSNNITERTGYIIKTPGGVYVTGKITNEEDWNQQQRLDGWYKLNTRINRITL